jgi:hypothetical protein
LSVLPTLSILIPLFSFMPAVGNVFVNNDEARISLRYTQNGGRALICERMFNEDRSDKFLSKICTQI